MRVKIQQVLPQGFDKVEPHSWECELYKEDKNGQILVPIDSRNCREKLLKDMKIGDFVAVRLDEKSGKTGTIAGQIIEFVEKKIEINKGQIVWQAMRDDFRQIFIEKFNKLESKKSDAKSLIKRILQLNYLPINKKIFSNELVQEAILDYVLMRDLFVELSVVKFIKVPEQDEKQPLWFFKYNEKKAYDFETAFCRIYLPFVRVDNVCKNTPYIVFYSGKDEPYPIRIDNDFKILADELTSKIWGANDENTK